MGQHNGALFASPRERAESAGSRRGRCPFVKRPVTSTAFAVDPAGSLCIDLTGEPFSIF